MMARKNYSKISEEAKKEKDKEVVENVEVKEEVVENTEAKEEVKEVIKPIGIVTGCARLYVRKEANAESKFLCIINQNTEVVIDTEKSTEDFYKVCTSAGVEGYCMKKFISIK